ncbi:hypothetical protein QT381_06030 [Galbitalea sp. SE-J8]|uniref:hypothetical protein n=1 Tax=Galbitalea sp. SE-J8 TaxID=3054952 RepID=UPI00259CE2C8|nr:hypothetical protein [Galbitalea sp. SE-J8]MDM4762560.1 hypothetical protein [Galbitalea sp. SE-J8]
MTSTTIAYRTAGASALVATAGYIAIPAIRGLVENGAATLDDYPTPAQVGANLGLGVFGYLTFGAIGVAVGVLTLALAGLGRPGLGRRLGSAAGVAGALGFLLVATGSRAMYSFVTANLTETGADEGAQRAAVWAINVLASQTLTLGAVGVALWALWLVAAGREVLPRAVAIIALVLAAVIALATGIADFLPSQFLYVPLFALLGVTALVRARKSGQWAQDA